MKDARAWTLGAVALILVVIVAGYLVGISPIMAQISTANAQTATITTSNAVSQAQLVSLRSQYAGIGKLKSSLNDLRGSIPEVEGASAFFNELTALSATYAVTLTQLSVADATVYTTPATTSTAPPTNADGSTSSSTVTPAATAPVVSGNGLLLVPVALTVGGGFDATRDFVSALQTGTRLIFITSVTFSAGADGSSTATVSGDVFSLRGTSDVVTKQKLIPTPTATATPTATPTPTPTATTTTSGAKTGTNNTAPIVAPTTAPTTEPTPDPTTSP